MSISTDEFDQFEGQPIERFTLTNRDGLMMRAITFGAIVSEVHVPDRQGRMADIVLGCDSVADYVAASANLGAICGRVANRISEAKFELDGQVYHLAQNFGGRHHLHGGIRGFDKRVWRGEAFEAGDGPAVRMTYRSADGEEQYPGNVDAEVVYTLTHDNVMRIEIRAETDRPTPVNIVHHGYWNLAGHDAGAALDHQVTIHAGQFTPVDDETMPTGQMQPVAGTPFDFTKPKRLGADLEKTPGDPQGYDVNLVVNGQAGQLREAAQVIEPVSGRALDVWTTQPGMQLYTGNHLGRTARGKGGVQYPQYAGFCMETQHYPDSVNKPQWPTVIVRPGQSFCHTSEQRFATQ